MQIWDKLNNVTDVHYPILYFYNGSENFYLSMRGTQENFHANVLMCVASSAERLDPREPNWRMLPTMTAGRGCHTLAVLDEKM